MAGSITDLISWLALAGLICQLYLQRTHNEKSLKPLGQIDLEDRQGHLYMHVTNKGLGPMIIDRLVFLKDGREYTTIENCLTLNTRSYTQISVNGSVCKVVLPNSHLVVFETQFDADESETAIDYIRKQLAPITLKVEGRDIYDNKIRLKRDFQWFSRYLPETKVSR